MILVDHETRNYRGDWLSLVLSQKVSTNLFPLGRDSEYVWRLENVTCVSERGGTDVSLEFVLGNVHW